MSFGQNTYIYLLVAAATIYAIRALPLTLIQKEITNTFIRSFLYYVPYVTLAVMAVPAIAVAVIVAWFSGNLFKVALASCAAVYLVELFL